jgi:3-oxoacyl-ACP reductase-like protein
VHPPKAAVSALSLALLISLAGCGPAATAAPAATPTPAPVPTAAAATSGSLTGDCGEGTAVLIKAHLASRLEVVKVSVEGGCHDALIETTLGPGDALKGQEICELAAEMAYAAGDISSITVLAADTTELSIAIEGQDCIAEL